MTHPHAMISFAFCRDGRQLATGSECGADGDYESPVIGVVLWDVASGAARHVVPVEGGIGLGDQLRRGLAFCADGTTLAYDYFTNLVGALDTKTAQVRLEAVASGNDGPPSFAIDESGAHVFIAASEGCASPAIGSVWVVGSDTPPSYLLAPEDRHVQALSWRGGQLHVADAGSLASIDASRGTVLRRTPFFTDGRVPWVWPSPSGRYVAATVRDGAGVTLLDADTHGRVVTSDAPRAITGFVFDRAETRWAAVSALRGVRAPVGGATIFEAGRSIGTIPGPLAPSDWQQFADGVPFALSPDGRHALVLRPGGEFERWDVDPAPILRSRLATIEGALAVVWPVDDVVIAIGPRVLVFLHADGRPIARHAFPA